MVKVSIRSLWETQELMGTLFIPFGIGKSSVSKQTVIIENIGHVIKRIDVAIHKWKKYLSQKVYPQAFL